MNSNKIYINFDKASNRKTIGMTLTHVKVSVPKSTSNLSACIENLKSMHDFNEIVETDREVLIDFKLKTYRYIPSFESFAAEFWDLINQINGYMEGTGFNSFDYHFTFHSEDITAINIRKCIDPHYDLSAYNTPSDNELMNLGRIEASFFFDFTDHLYKGCSIEFAIPKVSENTYSSYYEMIENCPWRIEEVMEIEDEDFVLVTAYIDDIEFVANIDYITEVMYFIRVCLDDFLEEYWLQNVPFEIKPTIVYPVNSSDISVRCKDEM